MKVQRKWSGSSNVTEKQVKSTRKPSRRCGRLEPAPEPLLWREAETAAGCRRLRQKQNKGKQELDVFFFLRLSSEQNLHEKGCQKGEEHNLAVCWLKRRNLTRKSLSYIYNRKELEMNNGRLVLST